MPVVSVIIPTFGKPDRLKRTVTSVLEQTYSDFELLIVDDNDPTTEARNLTSRLVDKMIKKDERIKYICHDRNKNGSAARNTGIRTARGKYLSFLDNDDEYHKRRLERCVEALEKSIDNRAKCVYTGCEYRKNNFTYRIMKNVHSGNFLVEFLQLSFNLFTGSNIFILKDAVEYLNGFDESFVRHQDIEFLIRYFRKFDIIGLSEVLVIKNIDNNNKPTAKESEDIKQHLFETFDYVIADLSPMDRNKVYAAHYRQLAEQYLLEKKIGKAINYYKEVKKNNCLSFKYILRSGIYLLRSMKNSK